MTVNKEKKEKEITTEDKIGCAFFLLSLPVGAVWGGYVLSTLWGWFITPKFEGAPEIGVASAIGISLIIRYLTNHTGYDPVKELLDTRTRLQKFSHGIASLLVGPAMALGFGWVVHLFM